MTPRHGRLLRLFLRVVRSNRGGALIELALIMPVFTLVILGSAEFARLAYAGIEVTNAARAGVQYGAQNHGTAQNTATMQSAATNDSPNVTDLTATASTFCTCSNGTAVTCANAATNCTARIIEYVQVNTSASVNPAFHVPGLPSTYTLKGEAVMRVQQ
jgi:Flp pilus assembly protein TadG